MSTEGPTWPPEEWDVVESEAKGREANPLDELARIIDDRWHGYGYNPQGAAAAIIAAGYSKPRTITTATELDALRRFTVIRSAEGVVYEKQTMWHEAGSRDLVYWPAIELPVVVLQEGWGEE